MVADRIDQGKSEGVVLGERSEGEHVHGIIQRALQRREWEFMLRIGIRVPFTWELNLQAREQHFTYEGKMKIVICIKVLIEPVRQTILLL